MNPIEPLTVFCIRLSHRRFENQQTGTFVLYRATGRAFEVHSRQWDCGSRHYPVSCTCGLAAREGNEVVTLDMCNGQLQETRPQLSIKSLGSASANKVKIHEMHHGKKLTGKDPEGGVREAVRSLPTSSFQIQFPSGAFVRADVADWGMSVTVRAPSRDFNRTRGLCGTFDRNTHNDLHGPEGHLYQNTELDRFIQEVGLEPGESLFDRTPPAEAEQISRSFCACQSGPGAQSVQDTAAPPCLSQDQVDQTSLFPSRDATLEFTLRRPAVRSDLTEEELRMDSLFYPVTPQTDREAVPDPSSGPRTKRQVRVRSLQSLGNIDLGNLAYFFPDDHLSLDRPAAHPSWPTPSGLTSTKALELCRLALVNSSVGVACGRVLGRRLEEAVDLCVLDLQLKDDLAWEDALLPFLENECERRWLENRASVSGGEADVAMALRCPSLCNGKGKCMEWGCQCDPGHSHYDCSLTISQRVELTDLENGGMCDVRAQDCDGVRVFGLGFIDSPRLTCVITKLTVRKPGITSYTQLGFLWRTLLLTWCRSPLAVGTGRCPTGRCPTGRCPQDAAPQDAAHRMLPHRMLPTGCCPTGRFPQDAAHRTLPTGRCPTGRCPQDAAHRTLPQDASPRTLPPGRCPQDAQCQNCSANCSACGQLPVGRVLCLAPQGHLYVGQCPVEQRPVGSVLRAVSCGTVSCGQRPEGSVLWAASFEAVSCGAASCGQHPVPTDEGLEDAQHCTVQQQMSHRL
ncbi:hypothetical protein NFI96_020861 [Prochilodus magdalenae]|nr:hypothetical protein NFI96_020861 [Prochilodus magdalenae]